MVKDLFYHTILTPKAITTEYFEISHIFVLGSSGIPYENVVILCIHVGADEFRYTYVAVFINFPGHHNDSG